MGNPKVSIILPTYNVEKYLHQCLDSIGKQTYKNIEVIIIIDGATDHSYEIAKQFCSQDSRFQAYWQENAGSGPARNHGLEKATGELIMFVDPDDWCKPDYVSKIVAEQQKGNYDLVVVGKTTVFFDDNGNVKNEHIHNLDRCKIQGVSDVRIHYANLFELGVLHAPHCKIYNSKIIKENNILFPDLRRSQDIVFNYRYYNYIHNVLVCNNSGYMYRVLSKERTLRLKHDYHKTIALIYNDIKTLHKSWNCVFNEELFCTVLFGAIYALFESNVLRHEKIDYILQDETITNIIQKAKPNKVHLKLVKKAVLHKQFLLAGFVVKILYLIKLKIK